MRYHVHVQYIEDDQWYDSLAWYRKPKLALSAATAMLTRTNVASVRVHDDRKGSIIWHRQSVAGA